MMNLGNCYPLASPLQIPIKSLVSPIFHCSFTSPSLRLRSPFVLPSFWVRFHRWSIYGLTTDLKRTYCEGRKNVGKSDDLKEKIRA